MKTKSFLVLVVLAAGLLVAAGVATAGPQATVCDAGQVVVSNLTKTFVVELHTGGYLSYQIGPSGSHMGLDVPPGASFKANIAPNMIGNFWTWRADRGVRPLGFAEMVSCNPGDDLRITVRETNGKAVFAADSLPDGWFASPFNLP